MQLAADVEAEAFEALAPLLRSVDDRSRAGARSSAEVEELTADLASLFVLLHLVAALREMGIEERRIEVFEKARRVLGKLG
jgi:hypothetical protein